MANSREAQSLTDEPCISIIITTLNEEKFISGCLTSCLEQKNIEFKIILVDGGSTDLTLEIASSILRPCDDIISLPGSSIYEAWNKDCVEEPLGYVFWVPMMHGQTSIHYQLCIHLP